MSVTMLRGDVLAVRTTAVDIGTFFDLHYRSTHSYYHQASSADVLHIVFILWLVVRGEVGNGKYSRDKKPREQIFE